MLLSFFVLVHVLLILYHSHYIFFMNVCVCDRGSKWRRNNVQNQENNKDEEGICHVCCTKGGGGNSQWVAEGDEICVLLYILICVMYTYHCFFCGGNEFIRCCATLEQCVSCLMGRTSTQIPPPQLWIVSNMFIFPCSCLYMRCMNYSWYILRWMICRIEITKMNDKKQQLWCIHKWYLVVEDDDQIDCFLAQTGGCF